jgi:hypothetical protein
MSVCYSSHPELERHPATKPPIKADIEMMINPGRIECSIAK